MIQLQTKTLEPAEILVLNNLQSLVNAEPTFKTRAAKASALWKTKGTAAGKRSFNIIRDTLVDMCVFINVCNYCEQSEANDIEHIHPKSFFTSHAFQWDNYILACKQCNSGHKLDKGYVLDNSNELVALKRGHEPAHSTIAFINIRTEDPNTFMILNPVTFKFDILDGLSKGDNNKADATLRVLELNTRSTLLEARKSAARHYFEVLERLTKVINSNTIQELKETLNPIDDKFDLTKPLDELKFEINQSIKNYISTYQHPSVWYIIKTVQSKVHPRWIELFAKIPEALNW